MTSVLYFLHLKTLDIILLIVNISVADDAFINQMFYYCNLKITFYMKMLIFNSLLLLRRLKVKNGLTSLFITVNKYCFCISVIGYINVQSIGYKKSISVDH